MSRCRSNPSIPIRKSDFCRRFSLFVPARFRSDFRTPFSIIHGAVERWSKTLKCDILECFNVRKIIGSSHVLSRNPQPWCCLQTLSPSFMLHQTVSMAFCVASCSHFPLESPRVRDSNVFLPPCSDFIPLPPFRMPAFKFFGIPILPGTIYELNADLQFFLLSAPEERQIQQAYPGGILSQFERLHLC
jgi:hypothetical protein